MNESVIDETIVNDSKTEEDSGNDFSQPDILEQSIVMEEVEEKVAETVGDEDEDILEEVQSQSLEIEDEPEEGEEEEEEGDEEEEELGNN